VSQFHPPEPTLTGLIAAARWALSLGLYGGVLLGLSFVAHEKVFLPVAIVSITVLTLGFTYGISSGLKNWENVPPLARSAELLGGPGFILNASGRPIGTSLVLLRGPSEPRGPRVVAIPGRPLEYQAAFPGKDPMLGLEPVSLMQDSPWFLRNIAIDLRLNGEHLRQLVDEGPVRFAIYAGALIFMLCSLSFIFQFSAWPLVNMLLACLAFRGILAFEIFFNSPEMQGMFHPFLQNLMPLSFAAPLLFCSFGFLACLYSALVFIARKQVQK
jgi:hypothetical protein